MDGLAGFCWAEWSHLGVLVEPRTPSGAVVDLEALAVLSLRVGRHDARLFDEVLDWLAVNDRLVSARRLATLADDLGEASLVFAAQAWVRREVGRPHDDPERRGGTLQPVFLGQDMPTNLDRVFHAYGWAKPFAHPILRSLPPELDEPQLLGLRLRLLLGIGARAEVMRTLLTTEAPWMTAAAVTLSAGYAKRNVHEALSSLVDAGALAALSVGGQVRYRVDREKWRDVLSIKGDAWPREDAWPQLFVALLKALRFLEQDGLDELSDYLFASRARDLQEELRPDLAAAGGAPVLRSRAHPEELGDTINVALRLLSPGS